MNQSDCPQRFPNLNHKQELIEIEEERKDFMSLFDQLLLSSYSHEVSPLSDFFYFIPQDFVKKEENTVKLELNVPNEVQQLPTAINQSVKIEQEIWKEVKVQQKIEEKKCSCPCSRWQKSSCPCYKGKKIKCGSRCKCIGRHKMITKNLKKIVMMPFWSMDDLA